MSVSAARRQVEKSGTSSLSLQANVVEQTSSHEASTV